MGAAKGGGQQATDYLMSVHMGVCAGPVDAVTGIYVDQKPLWEGELGGEEDLSINLPHLFGGPKQQGGCVGNIHVFFGGPAQVIPDAIAEYFGATSATCPGYRGMLSLFFSGNNVVSAEQQSLLTTVLAALGFNKAHANAKSFMWTSNDPVIAQNLDVKVRRIPNTLNTTNGRISALVDTDFLIGNASDAQTLAVNIAASINANSRFFTAAVGSNPDNVIIKTIRNDSVWLTSVNALDTETGKNALAITNMTMQNGSYTCTLQIINMPVISGMTFTVGQETYTFYEGGDDANGAHIIYDCLTNDDWGLGYPAALIDVNSFQTVASTLYAESLGLSLIWTQQSKIEDFVNEILNHIQGVMYVSPTTGLLTLKLIRDDYDPTTLPVFSPDNANLTSHQERDWGDTINEIVVTWTNPLTEQGETVSVQDLGNIAIQGEIVSDSRNYYGVRNSALALRLAARELRSVSAPLTSLELEVDRSAWTVAPGECIIVNWPENNIAAMVCRVGKIDYGKLDDPKITVQAVQDIFSLDHPPVQLSQVTAWVDPAAGTPTNLPSVQIFTLPYFMAASAFMQSGQIPLTYPEVLAAVFGYTGDRTVHDIFLYGQIADAAGNMNWTSLGTLTITEEVLLGTALNAEATTSVTSSIFTSTDRAPNIGDFLVFGTSDAAQEFALVTASDGTNVTLGRGVLDTVPQAWPVGTPVWVASKGALTVDEKNIRSAGETVDYRLLPRGTVGTLPLSSATDHSQQLTARPYLPLRPANVQVNGVGFGPVAVGTATTLKVTWSTRNRTLEDTQVLAWTDGPVTPEYLQQTIVTVSDMSSGAVVYQQGSLWSDTELDLPVAWFDRYSSIKITVSSSMSGVASLQAYSLVVTGLPGNANAAAPPPPPAAASAPSPVTAPGANVFSVSGASITGADGNAYPALTISGTPDTDAANTSLIVQFRKTGTQAWTTAAPLSLYGAAVSMVLSGVASSTEYDVQVAYEQPYENAYVTSSWVTAVGSPVTTGAGTGGLDMLDGPNRVLFSQFEKGTYGWQSVTGEETTSSPLHTVTGADSLTYGAMAGVGNGATDGGIYIAIQQADLIPVTPNETLFVGGKTIFSGACTGQIVVQWFDSTQAPLGQVNEATGVIAGDGVARIQGGFVTVPATAAFASLEFGANGIVGTTQNFGLQFTQAILCSAAPGQSTWPSFIAGPAAVPGADVTGSNQSASVAGQGPWATANVTYSATAPTTPADGDVWVNTSKVPNVWQSWNGTAWVATTPTDTMQLADGANLGKTALWGSVASRPANISALSGSEVIDNSKVPAGGVNRISFSQFEKGTAYWTTIDADPGVTGTGVGTGTFQGKPYLQLFFTAAAAGESISVWNSVRFPVNAGETLYVSSLFGTANCKISAGLAFFDGSGTNIKDLGGSQNSPSTFPTQETFTCLVPAGAVAADFYVYATALTAGNAVADLGQPFVCGIQAGQAVFPNFNAGPNAENGADVTDENTSAGIAGQGGLATLDAVGTPQIDTNAVTNAVGSNGGSTTMTGGSTYTANSLSITATGAQIFVSAAVYMTLTYPNGPSTCLIELVEDGVAIISETMEALGVNSFLYTVPMQYTMMPPAGVHSYSIIVKPTAASGFSGSIAGSSLFAIELKR